MNKITMDKTYRTRDGRQVRVICVDRNGAPHSVVALVRDPHTGVDQIKTCNPDGRTLPDAPDRDGDLIEVSPWDDFKIDEPVYIRDSVDNEWMRRHFAGVAPDGRPSAWTDGCTSWSGAGRAYSWNYCRRPTPEELEGKA